MFGAFYGVISDPSLLAALREVHIVPRLPAFALSGLTLNDFLVGAVFLAIPQVPLTLGNAVIAITEENNRLFPQRQVNESKISTSTGLVNLLSAGLGGVPMCHGAGGMLRLFPTAVLGVILFLTGAQLALGACDVPKDKGERFVLMVTGALAIWNVGIAFVVGEAAYWLNKKGLVRV